ncbi:DUF6555 family protein [Pseudomonas sp. NR3]|uniref:DUF6555 family protein n=1 Tax=Pseudomonas sp. NR3 TaxID=3155978 RepID=UPI003B6737BB
MQTLNTYEIHYVFGGVKRVTLHTASQMSDGDAWTLAAIACGVSFSVMLHAQLLSAVRTVARSHGVSNVRWNLSPRYAKRNTLAAQGMRRTGDLSSAVIGQ